MGLGHVGLGSGQLRPRAVDIDLQRVGDQFGERIAGLHGAVVVDEHRLDPAGELAGDVDLLDRLDRPGRRDGDGQVAGRRLFRRIDIGFAWARKDVPGNRRDRSQDDQRDGEPAQQPPAPTAAGGLSEQGLQRLARVRRRFGKFVLHACLRGQDAVSCM